MLEQKRGNSHHTVIKPAGFLRRKQTRKQAALTVFRLATGSELFFDKINNAESNRKPGLGDHTAKFAMAGHVSDGWLKCLGRTDAREVTVSGY